MQGNLARLKCQGNNDFNVKVIKKQLNLILLPQLMFS